MSTMFKYVQNETSKVKQSLQVSCEMKHFYSLIDLVASVRLVRPRPSSKNTPRGMGLLTWVMLFQAGLR